MSFYDSASLVFLPSGGAGKDGKAYSIKPVPEYGNELVTNGGFDTDSDWTKTNATISGGVATITSTGYAYAAVFQNNVLTIGKTYKATIDVNSIVGGLRVATSQVITNSGIASVTFTATNTYLDIRRDSSFATTTAVIDNVSVKEVIVDGDFTFSRGINLTATRVDSNGLIEKGRENLFTYSNTFSNASWNKSETSVTSGQSGYDGSLDAWNLIPSTTNTNSHRMYKDYSSSGSVFAASIYAKANGYNFLKINNYSAGVVFDISTGNPTSGTIVSESGSPIDSNIISVGNGWYRIDVTKNSPSGNLRTQFFVQIDAADSSFSGDGTSGVLIQDAQLEIGLVATEYIESGATTGKAGLLEDSPRFDYSGGASCPSLLLEPSRTNLIGYSEYFDAWFNNGGTLTANAATSPEGFENAYSYSNNEYTILRELLTLSTSTQYTFSFYAKNVDATDAKYRVYDDTNTTDVISATSYFSQLSTNEWKRIEVTFTTSATGTAYGVYLASGKQSGKVLFYGAQVEEGSYPTSYIPNHSGGSVTRNMDDLNDLDISSMLTTSSFTWFLDLNDYIGSDINQETIFLESSPNLKIQLRVRPDGYRFYYNNIAGGSTYPIAGSTTANKFCVSYDGNDYRLYVDGTLEATTRSVGDSGWDYIKNAIAASLPLKQILLFPTALSDADCEILTGTSYESFAAMAAALNYTTYE